MNPNPNPETGKSTGEIELKRGDIYVNDGTGSGRKYRLRKESSVVVEVGSKRGVMLKYYGLYASFTTVGKVVWISMSRNSIYIHVSNDEHVDNDRIILSSYGNGKVDEITQGFVDALTSMYGVINAYVLIR